MDRGCRLKLVATSPRVSFAGGAGVAVLAGVAVGGGLVGITGTGVLVAVGGGNVFVGSGVLVTVGVVATGVSVGVLVGNGVNVDGTSTAGGGNSVGATIVGPTATAVETRVGASSSADEDN